MREDGWRGKRRENNKKKKKSWPNRLKRQIESLVTTKQQKDYLYFPFTIHFHKIINNFF